MPDNDTCGATAPTCAKCNKPITGNRSCAGCHSVYYCNRRCERSHHATHKDACAQAMAATSSTTTSSDAAASSTAQASSFASSASAAATTAAPVQLKNLDVAIPNPFHRIRDGTWLYARSEQDTYKLLIDSYRLRVHDQHKYHRIIEHDCILNGNVTSGLAGFSRYLTHMHRFAPDLFPLWWDEEKEEACKALGMGHGWENLRVAVKEEEVKAYYGDDDAALLLQLKLFADSVFGDLQKERNAVALHVKVDKEVEAERGEREARVLLHGSEASIFDDFIVFSLRFRRE